MIMRRIFVLSVLGLLLISPISPRFWQTDRGTFSLSLIPDSTWKVIYSTDSTNISFGGGDDCAQSLKNHIQISSCDVDSPQVKWQSPKDWQVLEAIISDLNRDGEDELVMVVSRPFKPWPIDRFLPHGGRINSFQDKNGMSCHLILVGWDGKEYREVWAGSALKDPISHISSADLNQDGFQELVALEGQYDSIFNTGNITVWEWNGFGFSLNERIDGSFSDFIVISTGQQNWLLSD
jgi:hypothetical protein